jgi:hypothetical protein
VLVQEAGGPALTNYKSLKEWIDANSTSQDAYNKLLGHIGLNPDDVSAKTLPERLSRYAGQGTDVAVAVGTPYEN